MGKFLFKVEGRYIISNQGIVLAPGLGENVKFVKTESGIVLIRPDGTELKTYIKGIAVEGNHDILVPSTLTINEVPIGTEVWTID